MPISAPKKWCAKIYKSINFAVWDSNWEHELFEEDQGSLLGTNKDNEASSIKVRDGCTLKGFDDDELKIQIFNYTTDIERLDPEKNDKLTSYICECKSKIFSIIGYCFSLRSQLNSNACKSIILTKHTHFL